MKLEILCAGFSFALMATTSCVCTTKPQIPTSKKAFNPTLENFEFLVDQVYPKAAPRRNRDALTRYLSSADFIRHKSTAIAYFAAGEMTEADARLVLENRDPVNIAMQTTYDPEKLQELLTRLHQQGMIKAPVAIDIAIHDKGFKNSAYTKGLHLASKPTQLFSSGPYTVCVYSETFLWPHWNGTDTDRVEVAVLSVPAPALDSLKQPNYPYYVQNDILNQGRYEAEIRHLTRTIAKSVKDNAASAFSGRGIKRLVLSRFGQANFLAALHQNQRETAHRIFAQSLSDEIKKAQLTVEVIMNIFSPPVPSIESDLYKEAGIKVITGDILTLAKNQDLIINAWDPHSLPGNGNDNDNSLDGILGRATAILLSSSPYFNEAIRYEGIGQ